MFKRCVFVLMTMAVAHPVLADDDDPKEVAPQTGREKVKPMAPTWCPADYKAQEPDERRAERTVGNTATLLQRQIAYYDVQMGGYLDEVARAACDWPTIPWVHKQVAAWRQRWINAIGISEREDREHLKLFVRGKGAYEEIKAYCTKHWKTGEFGGASASSMELEGICGDSAFTSKQGITPSWRHAFWMDNPTRKISMLERLGYINRCISEIAPEESSSYRSSEINAQEGYAYCKSDARELDPTKLKAELAAKGASPTVVARYVQLYGWVQHKLARAKASVDKMVAGAPALKPWFIDKYDVGHAEWMKMYESNKADIDAAFAVQNKLDTSSGVEMRNRNHAIGCDPVRDAWIDYVTKRKPKNPGDVVTAAHSNVGYLLASNLALCEAAEGRGVEARALLSLLAQAPKMYSGARVHAGAYIFDGSRREKLGDLSTKFFQRIEEGGDPIRRKAAWIAERTAEELGSVIDKGGTAGSALADATKAGDLYKGRVATVKKVADGIHVVFKKEVWQEPQYSCVNDGINQWTSDGTPVYYKKCKFLGMEQREVTQDPITFVGRTVAGLEKGQLVKFARFRIPDKSEVYGYVVETLAGGSLKKEPKTLRYLGFAMN